MESHTTSRMRSTLYSRRAVARALTLQRWQVGDVTLGTLGMKGDVTFAAEVTGQVNSRAITYTLHSKP
eukprot:3079430-Rhodomonas_salina.1